MAIPKFYYDDQFRGGTLSGSESSTTNPVRRVADGDITIAYTATSGLTPSGVVSGLLSAAARPDALVICRAASLSGHRITVVSSEPDGSSPFTEFDDVVTDSASSVLTLSGSTARQSWVVSISGVSGLDQLSIYDAMLATELELPRSVEIGVNRTPVRQYARIPIRGSQAFTQRLGPVLRSRGYSFIAVSGSELDSVSDFVESMESGEIFYHVDDQGAGFCAELSQEVGFQDSAGVYALSVDLIEVAVD